MCLCVCVREGARESDKEKDTMGWCTRCMRGCGFTFRVQGFRVQGYGFLIQLTGSGCAFAGAVAGWRPDPEEEAPPQSVTDTSNHTQLWVDPRNLLNSKNTIKQ